MELDHLKWCRKTFRMLNDGGVWVVPRSGLVFKREGEQLRLIERLTGYNFEYQLADFNLITDYFTAAGIPVIGEALSA